MRNPVLCTLPQQGMASKINLNGDAVYGLFLGHSARLLILRFEWDAYSNGDYTLNPEFVK